MAAYAYLAFIVLVCVMLFGVLPRRRLRAVEALQSQLEEGDEIMTTGGMFGRITRLEADAFDLEIAPGTVVRFARGAIGRRLGDASAAEPTAADPTAADETTD